MNIQMNNVIKKALDTFKDCTWYFGEDGKWVFDNIAQVIEDIYILPEGEKFPLNTYISEKFGEDKVEVALANMMPYLTGGYGVLNLTFETSDGVKVDNASFRKGENKEIIKCIGKDGKELSLDEVYVVFRRNSRLNIEIPAPYRNFK